MRRKLWKQRSQTCPIPRREVLDAGGNSSRLMGSRIRFGIQSGLAGQRNGLLIALCTHGVRHLQRVQPIDRLASSCGWAQKGPQQGRVAYLRTKPWTNQTMILRQVMQTLSKQRAGALVVPQSQLQRRLTLVQTRRAVSGSGSQPKRLRIKARRKLWPA